jgi:hypothetical protein
MKNMIPTVSLAASLCAALAVPLAAGQADAPAAGAASAPVRCSNHTLLGRYGGSAEGKLLPAPGVALEFRGLTQARFDGHGGLTWLEHTVVDGAPVQPGWASAAGTYTVNADCTGQMLVNSPNSPEPLSLSLVVVSQGREVRTVLDAHAILSIFRRVD